MIAASGRTSFEAIMAIPTNSSSTPAAMDRSRCPVSNSSVNIARAKRMSATAITTIAM